MEMRTETKIFMGENYLANYVQSVFNALKETDVPVQDGTLVVSGDGRYWNAEAIQIIIQMAFANGVKHIYCGTNGLLSTPATSAVIRHRAKRTNGPTPFGGFICSASHNPGGPNDDIGMHAFDVVKPLADLAEKLSGLKAATGRDKPTVIT